MTVKYGLDCVEDSEKVESVGDWGGASKMAPASGGVGMRLGALAEIVAQVGVRS